MSEAPRRWRRVDGVLLLDKPSGASSNAVLQRARRLFAAEKAGHTGTLDPLASGLLPVCFGEATKFAQGLLEAPKRYTATIRFGFATTTGDAEGEVVARGPEAVDAAALRAALDRFVGARAQVPPRHSALKHEGRAHYEYAREGIDVPREARVIEILALRLVALDAPLAVVDVACSKGTYVRVLAEDIGAALGTRAHLAALRRTGTGGFDVRDAATLDVIEALEPAARDRLLLPVDAPLAALPRVNLDEATAYALRMGRRPSSGAPEGRYRAYAADGAFVGLVEAAEGALRSIRLLRAVDPPPAG
jgi:tRNA pseudouridine55 synthase